MTLNREGAAEGPHLLIRLCSVSPAELQGELQGRPEQAKLLEDRELRAGELGESKVHLHQARTVC